MFNKFKEDKRQALTKMDLTWVWSDLQTRNFHHRLHHELRNGLLGGLFLLLPFITTNKVKIHWSRTTTSTTHDLITLIYNSFGVLQSDKKNFQPLLLGRIRWYTSFNHWPLPFTKIKACKEINWFFFQNTRLFTQCISMLYTEKHILHYYSRFSQIQLQIVMKFFKFCF